MTKRTKMVETLAILATAKAIMSISEVEPFRVGYVLGYAHAKEGEPPLFRSVKKGDYLSKKNYSIRINGCIYPSAKHAIIISTKKPPCRTC